MTPSDTAGPRPGPDHGGPDDDPTGIRALLAALPEPRPMPQDLVERIEARLAVEQAHRQRDASGPLAARSDSVIDLAAERSHRRPGRTVALLGAAAAGLLVATVAIGELGGVGPAAGPSFDSAAQVPARTAAGAEGGDSGGQEAGDGGDTAGGSAGQEGRDQGGAPAEDADGGAPARGAGTAADEENLLDGLAGDVLVLPELGTVGKEDYVDRVLAQAAREGSADLAVAGSLTSAAAGSCWQRVGPSGTWPMMRAAQAQMDGRRVVVLLGTRDVSADVGQAMVMPWSCTAGEAVEPLDTQTWPEP